MDNQPDTYIRSACGAAVPLVYKQDRKGKGVAEAKECLYGDTEEEAREKQRLKDEDEYVRSKIPPQAFKKIRT